MRRFVQDNHSRSERGVLRGLHYQLVQPQGKLVRAVRGEIFDVAVDLRRSSPTFGQWTGHLLNEDNKQMLWIPAGFGHGFLVLSAIAEVLYKATDFYAPQGERSVLWNDPQIGIDGRMRERRSCRRRMRPASRCSKQRSLRSGMKSCSECVSAALTK